MAATLSLLKCKIPHCYFKKKVLLKNLKTERTKSTSYYSRSEKSTFVIFQQKIIKNIWKNIQSILHSTIQFRPPHPALNFRDNPAISPHSAPLSRAGSRRSDRSVQRKEDWRGVHGDLEMGPGLEWRWRRGGGHSRLYWYTANICQTHTRL